MSNIYLSKKIVIIGYMAAGKSTISQLLAHKLTIEAIDTDLFIENKLSISIDNIFEKHGELFFRKIEN